MEIRFLHTLCGSKVIILLSYRVNLFLRNLFSPPKHENSSPPLPPSFRLSYLNWNVNKLDIETEIFRGPKRDCREITLVSVGGHEWQKPTRITSSIYDDRFRDKKKRG